MAALQWNHILQYKNHCSLVYIETNVEPIRTYIVHVLITTPVFNMNGAECSNCVGYWLFDEIVYTTILIVKISIGTNFTNKREQVVPSSAKILCKL